MHDTKSEKKRKELELGNYLEFTGNGAPVSFPTQNSCESRDRDTERESSIRLRGKSERKREKLYLG
jgi:hypothetical protein